MSCFKINRDNLSSLLVQAYLDARQNERNKAAQLTYELNLEDNLRVLRERLLSREYKPDPPYCFIIDTPREVFAPQFQDRIVSHLLFNMIAHLFDPLFIYDSYSCRIGKGTLFGIKRLEHHLRSCTRNFSKRAYVLCLDVSGYFMNINKQILYNHLIGTMDKHSKSWGELIDYEFVDYLYKVLLFRDPTKGAIRVGKKQDWSILPPYKSLFNCPPGIGLPIGDVTSQLFSNIYMNPADQYAKRILGCKYYGRYVDDIRIVDRDKDKLKRIAEKMDEFTKTELGLSMNPKKTRIIRADRTVDFLGARIRKGNLYAAPETLKKFALKSYVGQNIGVLNSYTGYLGHFETDQIVTEKVNELILSGQYNSKRTVSNKFIITRSK